MAPKKEPNTKALSTKTQDDAALRAWLGVVRAYNQCGTVLASKLGALGYTTAQYEVVTQLHRQPGKTQQQLAQRCFVAKSGISMLIKRMEGDGWVLRSTEAHDARVKCLTLTALGQLQAERMIKVQSEIVAAMAAPLTHRQLQQLTEMMAGIATSLLSVSQSNNRELGS